MKYFLKYTALFFLVVICGLLHGNSCLEAAEDEWELKISEEELSREEMFFRLEEDVTTVSALMGQQAEKAPSIVLVITAKEIKELGVRTVYDLLKLIPGFDVVVSNIGQPKIGIRGVMSSFSNNVLVLQDGYRLNEVQSGSPTSFNFELPVDNIKRVEIIRGPGSTLYGSNALVGIINIITENPEDIQGVEVSVGRGSFETQQYNMIFGQVIGNVNISGFVQYLDSDGPQLFVEEDAQTAIDEALAPMGIPPASLAPGNTYQPREGLDVNLSLSYEGLTIHGKFKQEDTGDFVGPNFALGNSKQHTKQYLLHAEYEYPFTEKGSIFTKFRFMQYDYSPNQRLYPPGFTILRDVDGDGDIEIFPEGMLMKPRTKAKRMGAEALLHYKLFDTYDTTLGISFDREEIFDSEVFGNYDPLTDAALGSMQAIYPELTEATRDIFAIFLQESWDITDTVSMTGGLRYDNYNDFGDTFSPRGGLVWEIANNLYLKCLYGKAFRAPSLYELYGPSGSGLFANPDLKAETVQTLETAVGYTLRENLHVEVNGFYNILQDSIVLPSAPSSGERSTYRNADNSAIWGIETWLKAGFETDRGENNYLFLNYTYQTSKENKDHLVDIPSHLANIGINVAISRYINLNTSVIIRGDRPRAADDTRDGVSAYALVNTNIIAKNFFKSLEISCAVNNVLDEEYVDPSPSSTLPGDFPKPGRSFFVKATYRF